jgi:hypothetical protein
MLSWSWRSIKLLLLHLVGFHIYFTYINWIIVLLSCKITSRSIRNNTRISKFKKLFTTKSITYRMMYSLKTYTKNIPWSPSTHDCFLISHLLRNKYINVFEVDARCEFQLTQDGGKKQKRLDKYPMLCLVFWAPGDGRRNRLKHVEHL